jgi:uncharacterized membrane protein YphA (DoxX/SURF4 family)
MDLEQQNKRIGFLVLRLFLVQFWLLQVFFKLRDPDSGVVSFRNLAIWEEKTVSGFVHAGLLPAWVAGPYTAAVPYIEVAVGLLLLVGFLTRGVLAFSAFYLVSLDVGLMLQGKHDVVASNTVFLFAILLALLWEPYGRIWSIDAARAGRTPVAR